jgi:hypothetical protein
MEETVLASYGGMCGKRALERMEQMGELQVDAELSNLNESQLALAREFNKSCMVLNESGSAIFFVKKEAPPQNTAQSQKTIVKSVSLFQKAPRRTFHEGEVEELLSGDLDALDHMDLAKMRGKFRTNAESIARELNLDHLVEG